MQEQVYCALKPPPSLRRCVYLSTLGIRGKRRRILGRPRKGSKNIEPIHGLHSTSIDCDHLEENVQMLFLGRLIAFHHQKEKK